MTTFSPRLLLHGTSSPSICLALAGFLTFLVSAPYQALADEANDTDRAEVSLIADTSPGTTGIANATADTISPDEIIARLNQVSGRLSKLEKTTPAPVWLLTPGLNSNVPSAYGAGKGITGIGIGYQERTRFTKKDDGSAALVIGFGDPEKVGFDLQLSALDLSNPGDGASVNVKLHKQLKNDYAVAFGVENLAVRGSSDSGRSFYGVVSKKLRLKESSREPFSRVYLTGGLGTGRFRSEKNVLSDTGTLNIFGSAAVNLSPSTVLFTEWTGQALNAGASFVPFKTVPIVITPALADIAGPAGDGTRFTLGIGYLLQY